MPRTWSQTALLGAALVAATSLVVLRLSRRPAPVVEAEPDPVTAPSVSATPPGRTILRCRRSVTRALGEYPRPVFFASHAFVGAPASAYFEQPGGSVDRVTPAGDLRHFELLASSPSVAGAVEIVRVRVGDHQVLATRFRRRTPTTVDVDVGWLDGDVVRRVHFEKVAGEVHHSIADTHVHADVRLAEDGVVLWFMGASELYFAGGAGKITRHTARGPTRRIGGRWIDGDGALALADGTSKKLPVGEDPTSVEGALALVRRSGTDVPDGFALVDAVGAAGEPRPVQASLRRACTEHRGTVLDLASIASALAIEVQLDEDVFALDSASIELRRDGTTCTHSLHTAQPPTGGVQVMVRPDDLRHALYVVDALDKPRTATALDCTVEH